MVRHNHERGAIEDTGGSVGLDEAADLRVGEGERRRGAEAAGAVPVLHAVGREQVEQQQVRLVPRDNVLGRARPDLVAHRDRQLGEAGHLLGGDAPGRDQLPLDGALGERPLRERPGDRRRLVDRDPVHLRGRETRGVREVVDGPPADECRLLDPRIDADARALGPRTGRPLNRTP